MVVKRFDVYLVTLDPTVGHEYHSERIPRSLLRGLASGLPTNKSSTVSKNPRSVRLSEVEGLLRGSLQIQKTRPCLILSPDEMNRPIATVIAAPMTTRSHAYPTRIACEFQGQAGFVVLDQLRAIDKGRLVKRLGRVSEATQQAVLSALAALFAP